MDFDHNNVRQMVEEDRLSSLPDDLIHKILSSFDTKFSVQTCLLSPRWKILWASMPCVNFDSGYFGTLPKFSKFVTNVLSRRNHQIEVSSLKLDFSGAASQVFVRKIASYAFSHNCQEITLSCWPKKHHQFPPCLFSSQSLKHFTLGNGRVGCSPCITPKTPWDFPALTTLHLSDITLCDNHTEKSVDIFSKCVNLKSLTLKCFLVKDVEVLDIITPRLSNIILIHGNDVEVINLVAPQLENLTIISCSFKYINAPPGLLSLFYRGHRPPQFSKNGFHSLNKVSICLDLYSPYNAYEEEDARKTINMLQEVHSARYLTLSIDIIECLSSFPDLVSHYPSPFSNLISLTIDSSKRIDAYKVKMSTEARNFLLENSPSATFIMKLLEILPMKAMKQKEAMAKKKAQQAAEIETHMKELQASIEQGNMNIERKEKVKATFNNLMAEFRVLSQQKMMQNEAERAPTGQSKENIAMQLQGWKGLVEQFKICIEEMRTLVKEERICSEKLWMFKLMLVKLPKRERENVEAHFSRQLEEAEAQRPRLLSEILNSEDILALEKLLSDDFSTMLSSSSTSL